MKKKIDYEKLAEIATHVVQSLRNGYQKEIDAGSLRLFAVARGGLTFGHLVAYRMALPLGIVYPKADGTVLSLEPEGAGAVHVYLEDLVAKGRTLTQIMDWHSKAYPQAKAEFVPVVLDGSVPSHINAQVNILGLWTSHWMVFPHEEMEAVTEGDRGLFRLGNSNNSKPL